MAIFRLDKKFCGESLVRGLRSSVSLFNDGNVDFNARLPDVMYLAGLIGLSFEIVSCFKLSRVAEQAHTHKVARESTGFTKCRHLDFMIWVEIRRQRLCRFARNTRLPSRPG